ncbi:uroporphyrinogen-III synthase [Sphingobacterium sp. UT-1RO-CII-1]|uniref:uroporphyrinogen-III synthase n=1 Tax=Sphingobacterium sp. UT-1RO-CII-1 TaxID=2995225 RepID=UPI00227BE51D|nr:uroporphyrinogen-III synthase [Sphingobacterium sp. UT-1RO-CII-1]MCY4781025.1 uroporphyrinogen-III synthase [Sphingobacterium sp. UT-1RO-CII-1]
MQVDVARAKKVKSILVTLPRPENDKSPYFALAEKYNLKLDFRGFIHVEGVSAKDVRKEKINFADYSAVIFTSKNSVDHFFRVCEEMRHDVSAEMKYFCISETIALYLQKYIQYRKRKIFFGKQSPKDLEDVLKKHTKEKFLFPCSDVANESTHRWLQDNGYDFTPAVLFKTVISDIKDLEKVFYDVIVFFSPSSVQSLFENFPDFKQKETRIAAFGASTQQELLKHDLILDIPAPTPEAPSMTMAVEHYIKNVNK